MTVATRCACPGHDCRSDALDGRDYCAACQAGWHNASCGSHVADVVNPRLAGVDTAARNVCGRCGRRMDP